jgi:hypothetical protein
MTKQADAVKIYTRRDSATAALRKLGIKKEDYSSFIEVMSDGRFACQIAMAEMHLNQPKKEPKQPKKEPKAKKTTISGLCRALILDGKTDAEIMAALRQEFGEDRIGPEKNSYPCWYRCELRRKGQLPPAFETSARRDHNAVHKFED